MRILAVESSCDETSVAYLHDRKVVASKTYSQEIHSKYGGVVPEIASRAHIRKIDRLCASVFDESGLADASQLDLIAVTDGPGLAGALLVGISFSLGIHRAHGVPITGVNHLEGHIASVTIEHPEIPFPFVALVVSGGHTALYLVSDFGRYQCLGSTVDDAAGEAFDKVGKMLGFAYPAGRDIEQCARQYTDTETIRFPIARTAGPGLNFSFSGLKTAVKYHIADREDTYASDNKDLICCSFQNAVIESLIRNTRTALEKTGVGIVAVVGGVACNATLRDRMKQAFGTDVYTPSPEFCTDNAAMIGIVAHERSRRGLLRPPRMNPALQMEEALCS